MRTFLTINLAVLISLIFAPHRGRGLTAHGIVVNRKIKSLYSPGLVAVLPGHVPHGIWYLVEVCSKDMITLWNWVFAVVYIACFIVIGMLTIGFRLLTGGASALCIFTGLSTARFTTVLNKSVQVTIGLLRPPLGSSTTAI